MACLLTDVIGFQENVNHVLRCHSDCFLQPVVLWFDVVPTHRPV